MKRSVYKCKDYNGYKNVLFFMEDSDADFRNSLSKTKNYVKITNGKKIGKIVKGDNNKTYSWFADYSLKEQQS